MNASTIVLAADALRAAWDGDEDELRRVVSGIDPDARAALHQACADVAAACIGISRESCGDPLTGMRIVGREIREDVLAVCECRAAHVGPHRGKFQGRPIHWGQG